VPADFKSPTIVNPFSINALINDKNKILPAQQQPLPLDYSKGRVTVESSDTTNPTAHGIVEPTSKTLKSQ
jgi:hypothetical protein